MGKPWFAWYPGDYSRDTAHLSMMEDGAYRRLLDHYYSTGRPLPNDDEQLFRICRAFTTSEQKAVGNVLQEFFQRGNGGAFVNSRVERELAKQAEYKARLSSAAQKTNLKRWGKSPSDSPSDRVPQPQPQTLPNPPFQGGGSLSSDLTSKERTCVREIPKATRREIRELGELVYELQARDPKLDLETAIDTGCAVLTIPLDQGRAAFQASGLEISKPSRRVEVAS